MDKSVLKNLALLLGFSLFLGIFCLTQKTPDEPPRISIKLMKQEITSDSCQIEWEVKNLSPATIHFEAGRAARGYALHHHSGKKYEWEANEAEVALKTGESYIQTIHLTGLEEGTYTVILEAACREGTSGSVEAQFECK